MKKKKNRLEKRIGVVMDAGGILDVPDEEKKLDPSLLREFSLITGKEARDIRVHTGPQAAKLTQTVGARALAFNSGDIYFAPDQFMPQTAEGKALLAHEMTHVAEGVPGASGLPAHEQSREGEARARRVEKMVLAREKHREHANREPEKPQKIQLDQPFDTEEGQKNVEVTVDKAALEEKTYEILQQMLKLEQERHGQY